MRFGSAVLGVVGFVYAAGLVIHYWPVFAVLTVVLCWAIWGEQIKQAKQARRSVNRSQAQWSNRR